MRRSFHRTFLSVFSRYPKRVCCLSEFLISLSQGVEDSLEGRVWGPEYRGDKKLLLLRFYSKMVKVVN